MTFRAALLSATLSLVLLAPVETRALLFDDEGVIVTHRILPPPFGVGEDIVFSRSTALALGGIDPVTYFLPSGPSPGSSRFEVVHRGLVWRFTSRANLEAFEAHPDRFVPAFGGHDGLAVADERAAEGHPLVFTIIGKRVYLFRSVERRDAFLSDPANLRRAHEAWPRLRSKMVVREAPLRGPFSSGG